MAVKSKQVEKRQRYTTQIITVLLVLLAVTIGWAVYETAASHNSLPTKSKLAYVDGNEAVGQVSNFYRQYLENADKPAIQKKMVASYGSHNLVFYDDYYQHGFDPITCSVVPPSKVTTSLVSTGSVATVKAHATYPDRTSATIIAKVVLTDKLKIDSITCPGSKGNLPPKSTN